MQAATKDDLKNLATKSELKAEIKAVKTDTTLLKKEVKFLRQDLLKIEERVENLEEGQKRIETKVENLESGFERLETKFDKMMNTLDGFVGAVDDLRTDNTVGAHQTRELQQKVKNHEDRLRQIESTRHTV